MVTVTFSETLGKLLEERRLSQTGLAAKLGSSRQQVSRWMSGDNPPGPRSLARLAEALEVPIDVLTAGTSSDPETVLRRLEQSLSEVQRQAGASSATYYVHDPYWPTQLCLASTSGVKFAEAMHGLLYPRGMKTAFLQHGKTWVDDTNIEASYEALPSEIPENVRPMFGGFSVRETVHAYARLERHGTEELPDAILFLNFDRRRSFTDRMKAEYHRLFSGLAPQDTAVREAIRARDARWMSEFTTFMLPGSSPTNLDLEDSAAAYPDGHDPYFDSILGSALAALGVGPTAGLGTLHFYDPERQTLSLAGAFGPLAFSDRTRPRLVRRGEGIISWVVLRKSPLLVPDIENSPFARIRVSLNDDMRSELAVPLQVGGEVVGVMCLESTQAHHFQPRHLRSAWAAANRLAIAFRLKRQVRVNRALLEISHKTVGARQDSLASVRRVAEIASEQLAASYCDIWLYDRVAQEFYLKGANVDADLKARPNGFTTMLAEWKLPIWISIVDSAKFESYFWHASQWNEGLPTRGAPSSLNPAMQSDVRTQLGMPIIVDDEFVGVAWIKYKRSWAALPDATFMKLVDGFMSAAGLVLKSIQTEASQAPRLSVTRKAKPRMKRRAQSRVRRP